MVFFVWECAHVLMRQVIYNVCLTHSIQAETVLCCFVLCCAMLCVLQAARARLPFNVLQAQVKSAEGIKGVSRQLLHPHTPLRCSAAARRRLSINLAITARVIRPAGASVPA